MSSEAELIYETKRALLEWGIDKERNAEHHNFHTEVIKRCLDWYRRNSAGGKTADADKRLSKKEFPKDVENAIRHVFRSALMDPFENCSFIFDSLLDKCQDNIHDTIAYFQAYYVPHDPYWQQNSRNPRYKMKVIVRPELSSFKRDDLDPFNRFTSEPTTPEEYYFDEFNKEGIVAGNAFEAIVAFHSINNEACVSCKMRKSFRWDGGSGSSWKDIFCVYCKSTYEIKSKASSQKVAKSFQFNNVPGGSFYRFHEMKRLSKGASDQLKHYIVLVSRQSIILKSEEAVWPVHVAEIDTVVPRLTERSFILGNRLRVSSRVRIKQTTKQHWFNIPISRCDHFGIAKEVYEEFFPGAWERLTKEKEEGLNQRKSCDENNGIKEPVTTVEDLRNELEKLKGGESDDDWENCYDSD